jgi:hypothetical protein
VEALQEVTTNHGFPSVMACREFLIRARRELKKRREKLGEMPGSLVADFVIPDPSQFP